MKSKEFPSQKNSYKKTGKIDFMSRKWYNYVRVPKLVQTQINIVNTLSKEEMSMLRGVVKSLVTFVICLVLGVIVFRLDEVWNLLADFYTNFSWEMLATVLFTGVLTGMNLILEWSSWKKDRSEKKKQKNAKKENSSAVRN